VQMPSMASIELIQAASGLPVVSSSVCTTYSILKSLGLERRVPGAGALLSGAY
jgi:maleate isomerase